MKLAQSETQTLERDREILERLSGFLSERVSKRDPRGRSAGTLTATLVALETEERDAVDRAIIRLRNEEDLREEVRRLKAEARCLKTCERLSRTA